MFEKGRKDGKGGGGVGLLEEGGGKVASVGGTRGCDASTAVIKQWREWRACFTSLPFSLHENGTRGLGDLGGPRVDSKAAQVSLQGSCLCVSCPIWVSFFADSRRLQLASRQLRDRRGSRTFSPIFLSPFSRLLSFQLAKPPSGGVGW